MNKIFKYLMGVFILGICIINTTNAGNITLTGHVNFDNNLFSGNFSSSYLGSQPYIKEIGEMQNGGKFNVSVDCQFTNVNISQYLTNIISTKSTTLNILMYYKSNKGLYRNATAGITYTYNDVLNGQYNTTASLGGSTYMNNKLYGYYNILVTSTGVGVDCVNNTCYIDYDFSCVLSGNNIGNLPSSSCPTCPTCEDQYTSLQCQTEYNLIPIEDVTANYCKLNFDLIEPTDCPNIGEGTGDINRTAWYINNVQYPGTASLKIDIADFLEYSTTYNSGETLVDIIGVDADEDYIEDVIAKTQITPTKEDFSVLINGLQEFLPYIMIALLMSFFILLVKKVFK